MHYPIKILQCSVTMSNCRRTEQCIAGTDLNHVLLSQAFLQDAGMIKDCNLHNYFRKCNRIHIFSDIHTIQPISSTLSSHPVLRLHAPILNQRTQHARMQHVHSSTSRLGWRPLQWLPQCDRQWCWCSVWLLWHETLPAAGTQSPPPSLCSTPSLAPRCSSVFPKCPL